VYDGRGFEKSTNLEGLQAAARRNARDWTVELAIPWRSLGVAAPAAASTMSVLLGRDWPGATEIDQFPATNGGNHRKEFFATLTLAHP
jgi:hypothetical protein